MTFDPTTNRVQWYMLTDEEKAAIKDWPHGWESHHQRCWVRNDKPGWFATTVYRCKPEIVVKSTWQNIYPSYASDRLHAPREEADDAASPNRIAVLRRDTVNGVTTAHLEDL